MTAQAHPTAVVVDNAPPPTHRRRRRRSHLKPLEGAQVLGNPKMSTCYVTLYLPPNFGFVSGTKPYAMDSPAPAAQRLARGAANRAYRRAVLSPLAAKNKKSQDPAARPPPMPVRPSLRCHLRPWTDLVLVVTFGRGHRARLRAARACHQAQDAVAGLGLTG